MKKSIAMKWAKALRSGEYTQGKSALNDSLNNTYCCLGVLCEVALNDNVPGVDKELKGFVWNYGNVSDSSSYVLPGVIRKYAGMATTTGQYVDIQNITQTLMVINDKGYKLHGGRYIPISFSQLADWIEKNYHAL